MAQNRSPTFAPGCSLTLAMAMEGSPSGGDLHRRDLFGRPRISNLSADQLSLEHPDMFMYALYIAHSTPSFSNREQMHPCWQQCFWTVASMSNKSGCSYRAGAMRAWPPSESLHHGIAGKCGLTGANSCDASQRNHAFAAESCSFQYGSSHVLLHQARSQAFFQRMPRYLRGNLHRAVFRIIHT